MPRLSRSQAVVLAWFSFGMALTRRCGLTTVAQFLAALTDRDEASLRQRLREWCYDAQDKRGTQRRDIDVTACFGSLLGWVLSWWVPGERRLVLALDATQLRQTFTVLVISVVYRGSALPVAWAIVAGKTPGAWQPYWLRLLALLKPAVPKDWQVLVLTDRGLYAKWLFDAIRAQHWHPGMRINRQGQYRLRRHTHWRPLATVVEPNGQLWAKRVVCFKSPHGQLACTLLASWLPSAAEPWLLVTDLPLARATTAWYGLRSWIEAGFKDYKRGGWRWEQTKMTRPERAERLWLVMAVATLWALSVGGAADAAQPTFATCTVAAPPRSLSCLVRGLNLLLAAALRQQPLPLGRFLSDAPYFAYG